jgi:hypothetical protein
MFHRAFQDAVEHDLLLRNPATRATTERPTSAQACGATTPLEP